MFWAGCLSICPDQYADLLKNITADRLQQATWFWANILCENDVVNFNTLHGKLQLQCYMLQLLTMCSIFLYQIYLKIVFRSLSAKFQKIMQYKKVMTQYGFYRAGTLTAIFFIIIACLLCAYVYIFIQKTFYNNIFLSR